MAKETNKTNDDVLGVNIPHSFYNILSKAVDNKIYGSIEVFFEEGKMTQITQRIINKVRHERKLPS